MTKVSVRPWQVFLFSLAFLYFPCLVLIMIIHHGITISFWDEWSSIIPFIQRHDEHQLLFTDFFAFNNEHRIVLTKIIEWVNYGYFWGARQFTLMVSFIAQGILLLFLIKKLKSDFSKPIPGYYLLLIAFSALVFAPQMTELWVHGFIVQQSLTTLFFVLSVFTLASEKNKQWWPMIFALLATSASCNGLLIWPTLVIMAIVMRCSWRIIIYYTITGLITIYAYSRGLHTDGGAYIATFHSRLIYFFVFLGSLLGGQKIYFAKWIGMITFVTYCGFSLTIIRKKSFTTTTRNQALAWVFIGVLPIASALLATVGRAGFGISQALSDRYIAISLIYYISLLVLTSIVMMEYDWQKKAGINRVIGSVFLLMSYGYGVGIFLVTPSFDNARQVLPQEFALANNYYIVNTPTPIGQLYLSIPAVLNGLAFLKQQRLEIFHDPVATTLIGDHLQNIPNMRLSTTHLRGNMDAIQFHNIKIDAARFGFKNALYASGEFYLTAVSVQRVLIVANDGKIVGLGVAPISINKIYKHYLGQSPKINWQGFVAADLINQQNSDKLKAYVELKNGDLLKVRTG